MAIVFDWNGIKVDDEARTLSLKTGMFSGESVYSFDDIMSIRTNVYKKTALQITRHFEITFEVRDMKKPRHVFTGSGFGVADNVTRLKIALPQMNWW